MNTSLIGLVYVPGPVISHPPRIHSYSVHLLILIPEIDLDLSTPSPTIHYYLLV